MRLRHLLFVLTAVVWASVEAATTPMRFSTYWPCGGNAAHCTPRIIAEGVIQSDTSKQFAAFMANTRLHKDQLPPRPTIVFNSPGGNVVGAITLGRLIRQRGLDTEVGASYSRVVEGQISNVEAFRESALCTSACVLAFAGGLSRSVLPGARVGIHQFSSPTGNVGDGVTQVTVVALASYLEEMGVSRELLDAASLIAPTSLRWLSDREARALRLDNRGPELAHWQVTPMPDGQPVLELIQALSPSRRLVLRLANVESMGLAIVQVTFEKRHVGLDRLQQFPTGESPTIDLCGDASCISGSVLRPWTRSDMPTETRFQTAIVFSLTELDGLSQATSLGISDGFGAALSDVGFSTALSLTGFKSGIALLRRTK